MLIWSRLQDVIGAAVRDLPEGSPAPKLFEADHEDNGAFSVNAGLLAARAAVLVAAGANQPLPAVLIIGLPARSDVGVSHGAGIGDDIDTLLEWPGAAYLQYGFSKDELRSTTAGIIEGAKAPLPSSMLTSRKDLLRASANVRHWLEGRVNNEEGALSDFSSVADGELKIAPEHLEPRDAIPKEHHDMLDRLYGLGTTARRYGLNFEDLSGIRNAMKDFEAAWRSLEQTRAHYRAQLSTADSALGKELAARVCAELEEVTGALERAIAATRQFDEQIHRGGAHE